MISQIINDISAGFLQEIILLGVIFGYMILSLISGKYFYKFSKWIALTGLAGVIASTGNVQIIPDDSYHTFSGSYTSNLYVIFVKVLILISAFFIILLSKNTAIKKRYKLLDFFSLTLIGTFGAICLVCSNDFLTMFCSLSVITISSVFIILFSKIHKSKEAGFKYLATWLASSALILIGISFIYFSAGSFNFDIIYYFIRQNEISNPFFNIGCLLCSLGFSFNIALIPFSNWLSDVLEGTSTKVSLYITLIPVIAGYGIISRLIVFIFQYTPIVQIVLFVIGIVSILKGFLGASRQDNIKRFLGYSVTAQSGFILLGFSLSFPYGTSASLFYIISYMFMIIGTFSAVMIFSKVTGKISIPDLKGLVYSDKSFSINLVIMFLTMAGLPITSGFISKLYLFSAISKCSELYLLLLLITMLASAYGVFVYFRPIKEIFVKKQNDFYTPKKFILQNLILYFCAILTVLICISPDKIIQICTFIAYNL